MSALSSHLLSSFGSRRNTKERSLLKHSSSFHLQPCPQAWRPPWVKVLISSLFRVTALPRCIFSFLWVTRVKTGMGPYISGSFLWSLKFQDLSGKVSSLSVEANLNCALLCSSPQSHALQWPSAFQQTSMSIFLCLQALKQLYMWHCNRFWEY